VGERGRLKRDARREGNQLLSSCDLLRLPPHRRTARVTCGIPRTMTSSRLSSPPVVQLSKTKAEELISRIAFPTSRKGKGRAVVNAETRDGSEEELVRNERLEEALEACREESLLLEGQLRRVSSGRRESLGRRLMGRAGGRGT
jgi:hypothetical protein